MLIRVIIVDDERPMVEILTRLLEPISSFIDHAYDLETALKKIAEGKFNLVVLDLRLGVTGKEEALRAIRTIKSHSTAVLVVSGLQEPNLKEEVLAAGADSFVPKDAAMNSRALWIASYAATLHLPRDSYKSDSYSQHVAMLEQVAKSAAVIILSLFLSGCASTISYQDGKWRVSAQAHIPAQAWDTLVGEDGKRIVPVVEQ